jgi:uncharacterized membrane protein (DUF2068 family)
MTTQTGAPAPAAPRRAAGGRQLSVLRLIAVERLARGLVLLVAGAVLVTHSHTSWASHLRDWAGDLGLDPSRHVVSSAINRVAALSPHTLMMLGAGAIGYGILEIVEGVGLLRQRRWAEYLTVFATCLFVPLEVWELARHATLLKVGGLVINLVIVGYLVWILRRRNHATTAP